MIIIAVVILMGNLSSSISRAELSGAAVGAATAATVCVGGYFVYRMVSGGGGSCEWYHLALIVYRVCNWQTWRSRWHSDKLNMYAV